VSYLCRFTISIVPLNVDVGVIVRVVVEALPFKLNTSHQLALSFVTEVSVLNQIVALMFHDVHHLILIANLQ
jgi:hypothetical protein